MLGLGDLKCGDIFFVEGTTFISKIIQWMTFSKITHCGLVRRTETDFDIFETDGSLKKAKFRSFNTLINSKAQFFRADFLTDAQRQAVAILCQHYNGTKYDYWDVALNGLFFWLASPIRKKLIEKLGCKALLKCDEMTMKILYDASGYEPFKDYLTFTPAELYRLVIEWREEDFTPLFAWNQDKK